MTKGGWFKSSYSDHSNQCVEVNLDGEPIGVRDSKTPGGAELWFSGEQWDVFLASGIWKR